MGYQAHFYHQHEELLQINSTILIDVQLFEPSVRILFLWRLEKERSEGKDLREAEAWLSVWSNAGDQWPRASSDPGREPQTTPSPSSPS